MTRQHLMVLSFIFSQMFTFYSILETRYLLVYECMIKKISKWFFSDHTFGTPNPCCPRDILDESSTNERCNGSEMRGYTCPKPRYILRKLQKPG